MHVAFFRNVNLGQPRSPSRVQLVEAFTAEGAREVLSHQSNGTVAFSCDGDPQALADAVAASLGPPCGYADVALVRPLDWLRDLGLHDLPDGCELTVFDGPDVFPELIPWSPDPRVTVLRADERHAVVHNHEERRSYGTRVVEQRLGVPATSRGAGTVLRLLARLDGT
ncbi:DUF1697 domain-containing protein [Nocardioides sp. J2M5]|uniref:DUF1697 domain-containing protein n=1 Tax=Nocardioides palaemonis TaxID=2829810 RepID=UPI001BA6B566|nr:DUF1697 domain-containing protein [Nocardioides palaemonis]MBS2938622.1 DUF1697 domain-containing protein [Nocardioides palaemonis]